MQRRRQPVSRKPAYLRLLQDDELKRRVAEAYSRLEACDLCPRQCGANRRESAKGAACRTAERARVSSYHPHFGEEAPLVGSGGSGTIFFSWCNLNCQYCQNYEISQFGQGRDVEPRELAAMMLHLQELGCHNINFVSPTHVVPQVLDGVLLAAHAGLHLPLVYNTGGYDSLRTLELLDGVFDIYMPDMKYSDEPTARHLSKVKDYPAVNRHAVAEMHRQAGDLRTDERGIAYRGLLVRHLVLPGGLAGTADVVKFLSQDISRDTYTNLMDQYHPYYKAPESWDLNRRITSTEYQESVRLALEAGLYRLDQPAPPLHLGL